MENSKYRVTSIIKSTLFSIMSMAPLMWLLNDLYVNTTRVRVGFDTLRFISTMNSTNNCDFRSFLDSYEMSNLDISMSRFISCLSRSGMWNTCFTGRLVLMTMTCTKNITITFYMSSLKPSPLSLSFDTIFMVWPRFWRWNRPNFWGFNFLMRMVLTAS